MKRLEPRLFFFSSSSQPCISDSFYAQNSWTISFAQCWVATVPLAHTWTFNFRWRIWHLKMSLNGISENDCSSASFSISPSHFSLLTCLLKVIGKRRRCNSIISHLEQHQTWCSACTNGYTWLKTPYLAGKSTTFITTNITRKLFKFNNGGTPAGWCILGHRGSSRPLKFGPDYCGRVEITTPGQKILELEVNSDSQWGHLSSPD